MAGSVESPNTLISNTRIKILDLVTEGPSPIFWPQSGVSGSNPMCSIYFDGVPLLNGDGSPNFNLSGQGFSFGWKSGASGEYAITGFDKVEALIPLPYNTRVTNPPLNAAFPNVNAGYPKSVIASFNTTQYPDGEGLKVTTRVPALYTVDTSNGNTNQFSLFYEIAISTNNGPFTPQILGPDGDGNPSTVYEIKGKCTSAYYKTHVIPLPKTPAGADFYSWKVRVSRLDNNILSVNTANDLYVDTMAVVSSNQYRYPMSAMVGIELSADQFAGIPTRAIDCKGIEVLVPDGYTPTAYNVDGTITAAVYPGIWTGGLSTRKWTDNPAWIFYDIVTNKRYGLGRYIRPEWLDKWTLYQIAQFCDEMVDDGNGGLEPRFTCNVAIQQPQDAYTLLNNLVSVFRGMLYYANGRIFPVGSELRDPVFNFSNANVVNGAFTYSDTPRNTRSTVCVVKWTDPDNLFRTTPERVEDTQGIARFGYVEKQITAFATTSRGQAIRAANWILTVEQLLTETIAFATDVEGLYLRPGDVFNVYDNYRNNQQQGGKIMDFSTGREAITLDKSVKLTNGFTYFMAAIVPATVDATGITGSNQVGLIRNSQIETRTVTTAPTNSTTLLTLNSGFSSALFKGSTWTLTASGTSVTVFDQATQYKCLATSEPRQGTIEILGVKYNTGVNYLVNNNYSVVTNPPVAGDTTPPAPPTGLVATRVTGLEVDNSFYSYLYLSWSGSTSSNVAYYTQSGSFGGTPFLIGQPQTTGINYTPDRYGVYTFSVAANNANGYQSPFCRILYTNASTNPLGTTAALSGVFIAANEDMYYIRPSDARYTGYMGRSPSFGWHVNLDSNDNETPTAQFVTGYRARLLKLGAESTILSSTDISISGGSNTTWNIDPQYLFTGTTVKPLRGFTFAVDSVDEFNNVVSGARLAVNNPQPPPPLNSGFVGYNGGVVYNITPRPQSDISGIYLWCNASPSFTPTYDNVNFTSTNLAGNANIAPQVGSFYTWFSLVDTFGYSGSLAANGDYNAPIYGPISGNAEQLFGTFFYDISDRLSGAFNLLTGDLNLFQTALYQTGSTLLTTVIGLSGSITGVGAISTALNASIQTAVVNASGAQSTQINAVSARLVTTGAINYALAGTIMDALAASGGAYAAYLTQLSTVTTGNNATARLYMDAAVTGSVNGIGGAAQARWGFEIGADGKIASMKATVNSFQSYGTAVFGNLDLESSTFSAGSAGWRIRANGDAEFNNVSARGAFTGGAGSSLAVLNTQGALVGDPAGERLEMFLGAAGNKLFRSFNTSNNLVVALGAQNIGGQFPGVLLLSNESAAGTITLNGQNGSINCDILDVDTTSNFDGKATFQVPFQVKGNGIQYTGSNNISLNWNGANVEVYVDGSRQGTIPNP
jgi:predicted phage tail protein